MSMGTIRFTLAAAMLASCTAEPADCPTCDPPDLGVMCEIEMRPGMGPLGEMGPLLDQPNDGCLRGICSFDTRRLSAQQVSREECLAEGRPAAECEDEDFYSMAELDERTYCTCKCSEQNCPCTEPGFACRSVGAISPTNEYCLRVME